MIKNLRVKELNALHGVDKNKVQYMLDNKIYYCSPIPTFKDNNGHYYLADQHHRMCAWLLHVAGFNKVPEGDSFVNIKFSNKNYVKNSIKYTINAVESSLDFNKIKSKIPNKNNVATTLSFGAIEFFIYKDAAALNADKAFLTKILKKNGDLLATEIAVHNIDGGYAEDAIKIIKLAKERGIAKVLIETEEGYNFTNPDEALLIDFTTNDIYHLFDIEKSLNNPEYYFLEDKYSNQALECLLKDYEFGRVKMNDNMLIFKLFQKNNKGGINISDDINKMKNDINEIKEYLKKLELENRIEYIEQTILELSNYIDNEDDDYDIMC